MRSQTKEQVKLFKLIFTLNWEDPEMDRKALKIEPGDAIMTITSGGCNTLGFLLQDPSTIYTVDINPSQSHVIELKIKSMKHLGFREFIEFTGLKPSGNRLEVYSQIRNSLSKGAADFWDFNSSVIKRGFLINGRYERFVKFVGLFIKLIEGSRRINDLFIERNLEDQREFYEKEWNTKRTRTIFNLFFNKYVLARRGLKADYFQFDDGSNSFAESFFKRFSKVLRDVPVTGNYFLHLYLKGCYRSQQEVPDYLLEKNYDIIRSRLDRIHIITQDAKKWLAGMPDNSLNCLSLSNICELMSPDDTLTLFNEVIRTGFPDARICFRNLVIPREVPDSLTSKIIKDSKLSEEIFNRDRSFVYSKVAAYKLIKP